MRFFRAAATGVIITSALALVGCGGGQSELTDQPENQTTGATSEPVAQDTAPDITRVDLCNWTNSILYTAPDVGFGAGGIAYASIPQTVSTLGSVTAVTCEINMDISGEEMTVAEVSLISGGEPVDGADQRGASEEFPVGAHEGITVAVEQPPAALAAVQLEAGLVLAIEGFNPLNASTLTAVAQGGVRPLITALVESWDAGGVMTVPEGSFEDAFTFCDQLNLGELPITDLTSTVTIAHGLGNYGGQFGGASVPYDGEVLCGLVAATGHPDDGDIWPWNNPFGAEGADLTYDFTGYADAGYANEELAAFTTSGSCNGAVQVGSAPFVCEDGSGIASRRAALGTWSVIAKFTGHGSDISVEQYEEAARTIDTAVSGFGIPPSLTAGFAGD